MHKSSELLKKWYPEAVLALDDDNQMHRTGEHSLKNSQIINFSFKISLAAET